MFDLWIAGYRSLQKNLFEIHQAAADSQKIYDFLLTYDRKRDLNKSKEIQAVQESTREPEIMRPENELFTSIKTGR